MHWNTDPTNFLPASEKNAPRQIDAGESLGFVVRFVCVRNAQCVSEMLIVRFVCVRNAQCVSEMLIHLC